MVRINADQTGYVALLAVLIVGAVALAISLALLTTGTDRQRESQISQQAIQAQAAATACAEEALQVMHDDIVYTGTGNLVVGQSNCTYTVSSTGSTTRMIIITSTSDGVVKKLQAYATILISSISVTSWQEVG